MLESDRKQDSNIPDDRKPVWQSILGVERRKEKTQTKIKSFASDIVWHAYFQIIK